MLLDFGERPNFINKGLFQPPLGVQFKSELEALLSSLQDGNESWEIMTLKILGKQATTVYASFKLKKDCPLREKKVYILNDLEVALSRNLEKKFWFTTTVRLKINDSSHSISIWYHPIRKKDFTILQYQGVLNYTYIGMVVYNRDLQDELKRTNWYEFVYDLNTPGFKTCYREFTLSTFSFRNIYLKEEYFPHNRSKFIRIPSMGALRELFYDISEDRDVRRAFLKWLKSHEITNIYGGEDSIIALFLSFYMEHRFKKKWDALSREWKNIPQEFTINDYLILRFEQERTNIYVDGELFRQCTFLLLDIPKANVSDYDEIKSMDEAAVKLSRHHERNKSIIPAETEFWGHCSNLQAWAEHDYDTRLLHRSLAFPLLKKLVRAGDPKARKVFKEEIARRLESGNNMVIAFLIQEDYLSFFKGEEKEFILHDILQKGEMDLIRKLIATYTFNRTVIDDDTLSSLQSRLFNNLLHSFESTRDRRDTTNFLIDLSHTGCKEIARQLFDNLFQVLLQKERVSPLLELMRIVDHYYFRLTPDLIRKVTIMMLEKGTLDRIKFLLEKGYIIDALMRKDLDALNIKPDSFLDRHPLLLKILKEGSSCHKHKIYTGAKDIHGFEIAIDTPICRYSLTFYEKSFFPGSNKVFSNYPHFKLRDTDNFKKITVRSCSQLYYFSPKIHDNLVIPVIDQRIHSFIIEILGAPEDIRVYFLSRSPDSPCIEIRYFNRKTKVECKFTPEHLSIRQLKNKDKQLLKILNTRAIKSQIIPDPENYRRITDFFISDKNNQDHREILISSSKNNKSDKIE